MAQSAGKKRSDDAIALGKYETLVRELPRCLRAPSDEGTETRSEILVHVHRLMVCDHPGRQFGLALLLPEEVPAHAWNFLLLPPGYEKPVLAEAKPVGCAIRLTSQQEEDLKVWTQMCLEISRCERSCPLHPKFAQPMLTQFKDRSGRYIPAGTVQTLDDEDLPERSFWLLAPLGPSDSVQAISWEFLSWSLSALRRFQKSSSWLSMPTTWPGESDPAIPTDMALDEAVVLGPQPDGSRGSDVKCLCVDLQVKAIDGDSCTFKGHKFSRAAVNAGIAPTFTKVERNLKEEKKELEFKAEECELMPLTHGHVQVLRYLPSLLWRLEFVALMQEMTQHCDGLLQMALPSALGEAMTHSQVLSLPFHPPGTRRFCYERMELMGDAVLKLMACAHAAAALPRANEGQLSSVAQWCETNKWLRKVNEKTINVGSFLLLHGFRPKTRLSKLRQNRVPQKVAADAVEAALGAVFSCTSGALTEEMAEPTDARSMVSMGSGMDACWKIFRVLVQNGPSTADAKEDTQAAFSSPLLPSFKDAVLAELHLRGAVPDTTDANAAEEVEKAFGYRFRNRTLLRTLRAEVTGARRNGFQRLEFLGDAVLLVAVCCHIMQEYPDFDEGKLSETLHAFVCNSYLSRKLIRRFGQAQSLASVFFPGQSPQRALLPGYVETVLASEAGTDYVIGQASEAQALTSRLKFVADSYEALIAAVLLDTGGDMDETWAVFAKDFELPKSQVTEKIRAWHDHLQSAEKQEVGLESGEQLPELLVEDVPEFGKLPEGEGRKRLLDYCRRQGVKMRFEAVPAEETSGEVRMRCVVGGLSLPEAHGVSMKRAQDVAAEKALWELLRLPDRKPETKHEGLSDAEMPSQSPQAAPASQVDDLSLQRPKGVARQDLLRYCQRKGLQQRFLEDEEEDETNATTYCVRAKVEEIVYPEARAKNKGAAQDMAAELALLELRGPDEEVQNSQVSEGAETERGPASQAAMVLQRAPEDFSLDSLPSARPKGVDRQELQSHCSRAKLNLAFKEEVSGQSHCPTFRVCAIVQGRGYPQALRATQEKKKHAPTYQNQSSKQEYYTAGLQNRIRA